MRGVVDDFERGRKAWQRHTWVLEIEARRFDRRRAMVAGMSKRTSLKGRFAETHDDHRQ